MVKMLKEAAVSWNAMALPQLPRPKTDVMRGMAQGKYMPDPNPTKNKTAAKE
jgi:hypothetical protein